MWIVHATPPTKFSNNGWTFKPGHFPRKIAYKKDALELARVAREMGATNVKLEKGK